MRDFLLSYDTVVLRPKYSTLTSRSFADTSLVFGGKKFNLPVVPSNMRDVIGIDNARWMSENDYFYIMHRFDNIILPFIELANKENWKNISISVGVTDEYKNILDICFHNKYRIDFITIDVAHSYHENVRSMIQIIRRLYPRSFLIVGNVATKEGFRYLVELGVDCIKSGIGSGSICSTRYMTGFHLPTLHSIMEMNEVMIEDGYNIPIIADGGAKHYGDVAKALTFNATMLMSGGWFASCIDSPAKIINGKKLYRGSTSFESKGERKHIEGITLELEEGFTYSDRLKDIQQALQSSISYAGGRDLNAFNSVRWERILPFH
jgi:GMP reductase